MNSWGTPSQQSLKSLPRALLGRHLLGHIWTLQYQTGSERVIFESRTVEFPTGLKRTTVRACPGCENTQSALQSYCVRPPRPAGPAPSRPAGSEGGTRRSYSTAVSAAGSLRGNRRPLPGTLIRPCLHPPSRSAAAYPTGDPGRLRGAKGGLCPPAVVRCLHARIRAVRNRMAKMRVPDSCSQ